MPHLFADAETETLFRLITGTAVGGVLGVTVAVVAVVVWVRRQVQTLRATESRDAALSRVAAATADAAEAEAAATPIAQWQQIVRRQDAKMDRLSAKVDECNERHRECEDRASKQQTEIEALKTQNAGQQKQLDKVATRVAKIKTAVGLAPDEDSGPQPRLPATLADTDEHTPLPVPPPKG